MHDPLPTPMQDALAAIRPCILPPAIAQEDYRARLDRARALLASQGCVAPLVGAGASLRCFTGLDWPPSERLTAPVLPVDGEPYLVRPAF